MPVYQILFRDLASPPDLELRTGFANFAAELIIDIMNLIFATGNRNKLREASEILGEGFELVTPAEVGLKGDIPETGNSLSANSLIKAQYIYDSLGKDCFADDTGLEVEILGGAPGINTARYASPVNDSAANMAKLLSEMAVRETEASMAREYGLDTVHATRKARFVTIITLFLGGKTHTFEGIMNGRIAISQSGVGGFGYDPVFIPDEVPYYELGAEAPQDGILLPNWKMLTSSQISEESKNIISHRGKALRAMASFLRKEL